MAANGEDATLALAEDIGLRWKDEILMDTNHPRCDEFYYSRMPSLYELIDRVLCLTFLVNYILKIFISQNRIQFFKEGESIKDLLVIVPVLIFDYDCG